MLIEKRFKKYYLNALSKSITHFKDIDNKTVEALNDIYEFFDLEYDFKKEVSLLSAIEQGDKEKIKDLEQRAKKGETIRLI